MNNNISVNYRQKTFIGTKNNDPIKESTKRKLKELGIYDSSIKTETEAQALIKAKLREIEKKKAQKQEQMQNKSNDFDMTNKILANYNKAGLI